MITTCLYLPMRSIPHPLRERMRQLSFGPENGTMWRWTYQNGDCYAALLFRLDGGNQDAHGSKWMSPASLIAWACCTTEDDQYPVVGVYVDTEHRSQGLASKVAKRLLSDRKLPAGSKCYAVAANWKRWPSLLAEHRLVHVEWE